MPVYLKPEELSDYYYEAQRHSEQWMKPFAEYERIAGNKISSKIGKNMPRVNDGSLSASLIETPMNVMPTMQPGKFISTSSKSAWVSEIANIVWKTKIIPHANTQADFFTKEQVALYRSLKYGAQPRYNFYVSNEKYTGSDWSLPYVKNVKLEPGKYSVEDCDYIFLDIYYTKLQILNLIDQVKKETKNSKKDGDKPDTSWNIEALQKLADMGKTSKEIESQNINERDKVESYGIKTSVCFNRGIDAPFYMFSKHLEKGEIIREWSNQDPTGDLPITMQYCYETLESPLGIGRVELAGPTQNVLDFMTQAHVLSTQVGLQPPKQAKGDLTGVNLSSITFTPDALWEVGNADIEVVQNTSQVYSQFPTNLGIYKSQLQTLQGRTDGSVATASGNPLFSKTPQGIQQQQDRTNSQDNYLRGKADSASAKMAEKMMNIYFANASGVDILDITEEDRGRLELAGFFDDNPQTGEPSLSEIEINYEDLKHTFKFEYDPRPEADEEEKNRWIELIDIYASNPNLPALIQQSGYEFNVAEAFKKVVGASGASGIEKVLVKLDPEKMGANVDPTTGIPIEAQSMTEDGQTEQLPSNEELQTGQDEQVTQVMQMYNVDEETATLLIQAISLGVSDEAIRAYLGENNG